MKDNANRKLMLVDGNSILNRAFYALQGRNMLRTKEGIYTNAVYGFLNILHKYITEENPMYMAIAFDLKAPTFRHKEFEDYKAHRKPMPEELAVQIPVIKEIIDALNVKRYEISGYEADDIIGTLSKKGEEDDFEVIIVTGDKDSLQLVSEKTKVLLPVTRGGRTNTDVYTPYEVLEKYKVSPEALIDIKGLMGDTSDNIPGVPGIGIKTATDLISKFGSIENLYENIDDVDKKGVKTKLVDNKELAFLSKKLATIDRDVPIDWNPDEMQKREFNKEELAKIFHKLEFKSLIKRFGLDETIVSDKEYQDHDIKLDEVNKILNARTEKELEEVVDVLNNEINGLKDENSFKIVVYGQKGLKNNLSHGESYGKLVFFTENKTCVIIELLEEGTIGEGICEDLFVSKFKNILNNNKVKIISHDLKPLIVYFKKLGIENINIGSDTKIASYVIDPNISNADVLQLTKDYFNVEPDINNEVSTSNAILNLCAEMDKIIEGHEQIELYKDIELPLVEVLASMEHEGVNIDREMLAFLGKKLDEQIAEEMSDIYELAGEEFNINSPKQLGVILFEKLDLPHKKKTKTGYSTNIEVLEELKLMHPIIQKIIDYRQYVKLKSTYVDGLLAVINPITGRIHSSFNQTVTATGRLSSTEPNLQNIPIRLDLGREVRKAFVPTDSSHVLIDADYSQIELRVLAHIANDENMKQAFRDNMDIHTITASQVFGVDTSNVTSEMRSRAKAVNFGIVYGIGDFSLAKDIGVTRKEARTYIDNYLNHFKGVKQYMTDIVEKAKKDGYVTTIFNRRRYIPELKSSNFNRRSFGERVALNTPIQGTAADIIKIAMIKVYNELKKRGLKSKLILQVHDELIIDAKIEEKDEVIEILRDCMENAIKLDVPLVADIKTGENWYYAN